MALALPVLLAISSLLASSSAIEVSVPKKWSCNEREICVPYVGQKSLEASSVYETHNICKLSCGRYGSLWPQPTGAVTISPGRVNFNPKNVRVDIYTVDQSGVAFLEQAKTIFLSNVWKECGKDCDAPGNHKVIVQIRVAGALPDLDWSTDESSILVISTTGDTTYADVQAATVFGARHALETLSQFITAAADSNICPPTVINIPSGNSSLSISYNVDIHIKDSIRGSYTTVRKRTCYRAGLVMVSSGRVVDKPIFSHRGVLLDTARNFVPIDVIKRTLDAMATSKMNVFHWHATDTQSFPIEIPQVPQLQRFGAYSAELTYSAKEMEDIMSYAKARGIRVIMEIDSPAHAGNGWQWGPLGGLGDLAICINQQPWRKFCIQAPCGQMNPVNENLYSVLKLLYEDIAKLQPAEDTLHFGGDELYVDCWNSSQEIRNRLNDRGLKPDTDGFFKLWSEFHQRALNIWNDIKQTPSKGIVWTSGLTNPDKVEEYLPPDKFIIQTWVPSTEPLVKELLLRGYQLIVTPKDGWYLDHGFWGKTVYYNWRTVYEKIIPRDPSVLGGEVCMWTEFVDGFGVESRIWPRAGAAAERLWADPYPNPKNLESRFNRYRERLITRGVGPDAITPKWCAINEGECQ